MKKRPVLNYFGGKYFLANWIISHFPDHKIYVEPFGGGGSVLIKKAAAKIDVYNDLDEEIVNVFTVLRHYGDMLKEQLELTPYSRSEYAKAREITRDPIERARRTIIRSFMGIGDSIHNKSGFRNSKTSNCSPSKTFRSYVDELNDLVERMRSIIIEGLDYRLILDKYDTEQTLFYLDPPYPHITRSAKHSYRHEFTSKDHEEFITNVKKLNGHVIISSYENDIYDKLGWPKVFKEANTQKNKRIEVLYLKTGLS